MKNIIITGATSDIALSTILKIADENTNFILLGREINTLSQVGRNLNEKHIKSEIFQVDLSEEASISSTLDLIEKSYNQFHGILHFASQWHSNGKVLSGIDFEDYSDQEFTSSINITLTAFALIAKKLIPKMQRYSNIIGISGTFDSGAKGWLPYYTAKKALENFIIGLSQELIDKKIRINCVSPSDVITTPYKKYFAEYAKEEIALLPYEVADTVEYLMSEKAKNINGQIITVKKF